LALGVQFAIAAARCGLVDLAVGGAEGVGFCVGVVADALEAFGEALYVLAWLLAGGGGTLLGRGLTLSASAQRPIMQVNGATSSKR
jgi:hypothetical protein